jgi:hypothetical protein
MASSDAPVPADDADNDITEVGQAVPAEDDIPEVAAPAPPAPGFFKSLLKRWLVASPLALFVAAIAAAAVWVYLPPSPYVAYAKLYMPMHPQDNVFQHPEGGIDFEQFQRTQLAMLRSHTVLDAVFRDPKVQKLDLRGIPRFRDPEVQQLEAHGNPGIPSAVNPVGWLEGEIRIEFPDGPEMPRVTLSGDDPEQLKVLVTAIRAAYLKLVVEEQTATHRQERMERLKIIQKMYKERLDGIKETNRRLAKEVGGNTDKIVELKQEILQRQLEAAKTKLVDVRGKLTELKVEAKLAEAKVKTGAALQITPDEDIDTQIDKALAKELEGQSKLQGELAKARTVSAAGENDAGIRRLVAALEEKTVAIDAQRQALRSKITEGLQRKAQNDARAELAQINEKIKYYEQFAQALEQETERLTALTSKLKVDALDLDDSNTQLQLAQDGFQKVVREIDKLELEMPDPPRVRKWEDAVVVAPDDTNRKLKAAGLAGLGAFAIVLVLASFVRFTWWTWPAANEVES